MYCSTCCLMSGAALYTPLHSRYAATRWSLCSTCIVRLISGKPAALHRCSLTAATARHSRKRKRQSGTSSTRVSPVAPCTAGASSDGTSSVSAPSKHTPTTRLHTHATLSSASSLPPPPPPHGRSLSYLCQNGSSSCCMNCRTVRCSRPAFDTQSTTGCFDPAAAASAAAAAAAAGGAPTRGAPTAAKASSLTTGGKAKFVELSSSSAAASARTNSGRVWSRKCTFAAAAAAASTSRSRSWLRMRYIECFRSRISRRVRDAERQLPSCTMPRTTSMSVRKRGSSASSPSNNVSARCGMPHGLSTHPPSSAAADAAARGACSTKTPFFSTSMPRPRGLSSGAGSPASVPEGAAAAAAVLPLPRATSSRATQMRRHCSMSCRRSAAASISLPPLSPTISTTWYGGEPSRPSMWGGGGLHVRGGQVQGRGDAATMKYRYCS
eukprot:Rhum_TRINITY_DN14314_c8_g1::Rhum_TRINITY_DN14314_c8_g1_i1::g.80634::m.80634